MFRGEGGGGGMHVEMRLGADHPEHPRLPKGALPVLALWQYLDTLAAGEHV